MELMKSADCDLYRVGGGGPEEWIKLQKVLEPQYRLDYQENKENIPESLITREILLEIKISEEKEINRDLEGVFD